MVKILEGACPPFFACLCVLKTFDSNTYFILENKKIVKYLFSCCFMGISRAFVKP